jgi:hypothetical protein
VWYPRRRAEGLKGTPRTGVESSSAASAVNTAPSLTMIGNCFIAGLFFSFLAYYDGFIRAIWIGPGKGLGKRGERDCDEHMTGRHVIRRLLSILQIHYTFSLLVSKPILSPRASLESQVHLTLLYIQLDALVKSPTPSVFIHNFIPITFPTFKLCLILKSSIISSLPPGIAYARTSL